MSFFIIDIFAGGLYQEHHVDLRPTSLWWKVRLLNIYIVSLMLRLEIRNQKHKIIFLQVLLQRMLSKQRGPLVHLGLLTSGNVGSIRKNYLASDNWRQFWFCRRQNLWSVTILARYPSRGNFDFWNHYKGLSSSSQAKNLNLSADVEEKLSRIILIIVTKFKSLISSWSVRTVRRNYLAVVVL